MKKFAKVLQFFVWIVGCWNSLNILLTSHPPNVKCIFPTLFGDWFGGKDCILYTYNLCAEEVGWLDGFFYEAAQNFELLSKIQDKNKKKTYCDLCSFLGLSNGTTLMQI
jgi:hypothetical protein